MFSRCLGFGPWDLDLGIWDLGFARNPLGSVQRKRSHTMSSRLLFATLLAAVTIPISAQQPGAPSTATTTLDDQAELAVTVYNSDLALVRDVRNIQIPRGTSDLHFMDIAATVNPATVHFRSLTEPSRVGVLEQNYEYDLLEPDKLLRKYVGREVTLVRTRMQGNSTRDDRKSTRLNSSHGYISY